MALAVICDMARTNTGCVPVEVQNVRPQQGAAAAGLRLALLLPARAKPAAAGPIAQAVLPCVLPLGFHGNFTAA